MVITRAEAKRRGLKRYFTGKPCKHGHVAERLLINGSCCECCRLKTAKFREENPELARKKYREWKAQNPEKAKAATAAWRECNPDKVLQHAKNGYAKHRVKRLAWQAVYNARNKEHVLARIKKWRNEHPQNVKKNNRTWYLNHPDIARAGSARGAARRRNAVGSFSATDIKRIYDVQFGKCAYCREALNKCFDIDHIVPLIRGGTSWPANIQLCCEPCNQRKAGHDPIVFAQSLGRLL